MVCNVFHVWNAGRSGGPNEDDTLQVLVDISEAQGVNVICRSPTRISCRVAGFSEPSKMPHQSGDFRSVSEERFVLHRSSCCIQVVSVGAVHVLVWRKDGSRDLRQGQSSFVCGLQGGPADAPASAAKLLKSARQVCMQCVWISWSI